MSVFTLNKIIAGDPTVTAEYVDRAYHTLSRIKSVQQDQQSKRLEPTG